MEFHDIANIFPLLTGTEYDELRDDIAANGLREAIWTYQGKIIDGRNRYRACMEIGLIPEYREWDGNGSLVAFVVSMNLKRRHLTSSQRAVIALDIERLLGEEGKRNQATHTEQGFQRIENPVRAAETAAEKAGTNVQYVVDAKRIASNAPDLLEQVRSGEMSIPQAKREIVRRERVNTPLPTEKFRILYADPPWKYGNEFGSGSDEFMNRWTAAETHYPTMSLDDICALPVKDLAQDNAVLFLWTTSPMLEEAFAVIRAWGFLYKTSFVWDKVRHNFGHYNSVRHELLLVCTRGSCTPDNLTLYDSVQSIERTPEHSAKPEMFRTIIDTLYQQGPRIELFARCQAEGWEAWGNEPSGAAYSSDRIPERLLWEEVGAGA